jgi:hypothetical protein
MFNNEDQVQITHTELLFLMDLITDTLNDIPEDEVPFPREEVELLLSIRTKIRNLVRN